MSLKRKRSQERQWEHSDANGVFHSDPIDDRSSTFVGYFSPLIKPKDLQSLGDISSASHKILAWRRESNQQSITGGTKHVTDHDDDGEKYGGKRIERVLQSMQVSGACVVARWYGGVLLGPVRFDHIENCAKGAVKRWQDSVIEEGTKKLKAEMDGHDKEKLVKTLEERDQSIGVLRALAVEKEDKLKWAKAGEEQPGDGVRDGRETNGEPKRSAVDAKSTLDYTVMALEQLKKLEKARDATLSFLLKRIDKAEADLASLDIERPEPP